MSEIKHTTDATFDQDLAAAGRPVIVDFWAPWCGPCKLVAPELEKLAARYDGVVEIVKVNVDENQELAAHFQTRSIPHVIAFADGRPVDTLALLLVCDALPPAVFHLDMPAGWVPTVEYTVHVRGVPAPGPVRCVFRSQVVQGGFLNEDGEVWDSTGRLVAQSRQLGLLPLG